MALGLFKYHVPVRSRGISASRGAKFRAAPVPREISQNLYGSHAFSGSARRHASLQVSQAFPTMMRYTRTEEQNTSMPAEAGMRGKETRERPKGEGR